MTALRPLGDSIVVEVEEPPSVSPGGILLLPPKEEARQSYGTVLAVGPGAKNKRGKREPVGVAVGERIAFSRYIIGSDVPGQPGVKVFRAPSVHYVIDG
jgi:chaperonin GroES